MRVLFLHPNFPAQYRHVAAALAKDSQNEIVYGTSQKQGNIVGVRKVLFEPHRKVRKDTHPYLRTTEEAVLNGQAVYRMAKALKQQGFVPDVVCSHSGWGVSLYIKDAFPDARLINLFEWYYNAQGADVGFWPNETVTDDEHLTVRTRNAPILLDLMNVDWGYCPTNWQWQQFPSLVQAKLSVLHEGIDTNFMVPAPGARIKLPDLDLSHTDEIITYVARGMEPYRGFPEFMRAARLIQQRRPSAHIVVVGADRVAYGKKLPGGQTYKEKMLDELQLDTGRIHFTGLLPYPHYLQVVQASAAHIYLTVPFVLSWSMMECMAAGCVVVASDTAPVREMIIDGDNGLLVDFFSAEQVAERVDAVIDHPNRMAEIRHNARQTIVRNYALSDLLPTHLTLIDDVANRRLPPRLAGQD